MWLGEQITERGIGNGITMIIVAGIVAGLPRAIGNTLEMVRSGEMNPLIVLLILVVVILVTLFCVFVERAQRKIQVNYAKRQVGRRMMQGQSTHLPFKTEHGRRHPADFRLEPAGISGHHRSILRQQPESQCDSEDLDEDRIHSQLRPAAARGPVRAAHHRIRLFFYVALVYDARDTGREPQEGRRLHPRIRPGQQTGDYLDKVLTRLTLWGGLYIMAVCVLPEIIRMVNPSIPFQFGGTSLLIIVVGVMDFVAQASSHMMSHQYEGLMKKASLRGIGSKK